MATASVSWASGDSAPRLMPAGRDALDDLRRRLDLLQRHRLDVLAEAQQPAKHRRGARSPR